MTRSLRIGALFTLLFMLAGCAGVDIEEYADSEPRLDIAEYFAGTTRAWGMVQDYSGEVQRRFTVDIQGTYEDGTLTLDESFVFSDGETDRRVWTFKRVDEHRWIGTANDVDGQVEARQYGHAFHMRYPLEIEISGRMILFNMDDWMYLQPDGRLINRTAMRKFGVTLGEITLVFEQR
ncbi:MULTISPECIES: DUF3833 domain-containing protein [unclassified Halomonas]|uniref:DUF3833 domain-containing protein n=1 Tax=unclassified Halomonas TaxID=2609666 RepID=UPI001CF20E2E|nr:MULTISPECIES: DUF3833 domain-containing protein [unclassified Halomonas]MCA8865250.1 DUF3833 domain-containing protein [Halomonas sp. SBBP1]UZH12209.1 DUF3833 domain-containing protein [Halomonas sp. BDJS001]